MQDNHTELNVSAEVLERMAEIAACEIDGVVSVVKKAIDIKGAIKNKSAFKGVKVVDNNGATMIDIYICVAEGFKVKEVAEAVQENVKDKLQTMTATAVTKVNVFVSDIDIKTED